MKHAVKGKQLNRDIGSRRALFKNLQLALIEHGKIKTTLAKAKAIQGAFDKLVTKAKVGTLQYRRLIGEVLNQRKVVNLLVDEIAPKLKRSSGFTRIVKLGTRRGDAAEMVRLEIIDWEPKKAEVVKKTEAKAKVKKTVKTVKVSEKPVSKVKLPNAAASQVKHIPQKRIAGGGGK